jgi:hypothetical protein
MTGDNEHGVRHTSDLDTEEPIASYRVTFSRIGRNHDVPPLVTVASSADELAEVIYDYARPHLRSRDVEVYVDLEKQNGGILCGFNSGGMFTIESFGGES